MWYAILLACGSSTDNFAVGTTLGISSKPLDSSSNAIISLFNAFGAFVSAAGGHLLGELAPLCATLFAALIFAYLAVDEFISYWRRRNNDTDATSTLTMKSGSTKDALQIAIPMTLNNLAGGAAGGAAGIDAKTAGLMALLASFIMMKLGHVTGSYLMASVGNKIDTSIVAGGIFACLAMMQWFNFYGGM
jgi:putative Mn2+ efflux pump MntP